MNVRYQELLYDKELVDWEPDVRIAGSRVLNGGYFNVLEQREMAVSVAKPPKALYLIEADGPDRSPLSTPFTYADGLVRLRLPRLAYWDLLVLSNSERSTAMSIDLFRRSIEVIRAGQTGTGAYIACPNFKTYHYSWLRDGAFIANGMDRAGQHESALAFHRWLDGTLKGLGHKVENLVAKSARGEEILPQEWLHCRYTLEGKEGEEDWGNFQLDGYGTWLWSLCEHVRMTGKTALLTEFRDSISLVVRYLLHFWERPNYDSWEEHGEHIHPSTLACLYGGLQAINRYEQSSLIAETAAAIKRYVLEHFVHGGRLTKFADGRSIDANLLWVAVPFGLLAPEDPIMIATVAELERRCVTGGVHRYPEDTYYGGGEWLLLTAWLGWYYVQVGRTDRARELLSWIEAQADEQGNLTEQVSLRVNQPSMVAPWEEKWGPVASPLLWSHAMYLVLHAELAQRA